MAYTLSFILGMLAIAVTYYSWQRSTPSLGWAALAVFITSVISFSIAAGWEYGVVYGLLLPGVLVWAAIAREQTIRPLKLTQAPVRTISTSGYKMAGHLAHALVLLVGQLLLSTVISVALSRFLPIEQTGQLAVCIIIQPLLWAMLAYHYLGSPAKGKAVMYHSVAAALFGITLVL